MSSGKKRMKVKKLPIKIVCFLLQSGKKSSAQRKLGFFAGSVSFGQ